MTPIFRWLTAACVALFLALSAGALSAQGDDLDYESWSQVVTRAEQSIDNSEASTEAFEELRSTIAGWRDDFLRAESTNATRIQTLQSQLSALGDPPPEGESEPDEIADRRAELNDELQRLQAPVRRAEEAYTQADGLIREIDEIIRSRQADALLELGPSPLNPALWREAIGSVMGAGHSLWSELKQNLGSGIKQIELRSNLPIILLLLALAALLVIRGPVWVNRLIDWLRKRTRRGSGVWGFLASLAGIVLPFLGLVALSAALQATGVMGVSGQRLLTMLAGWGGALLYIRWLADQTFNRNEDVATLPLPHARRLEARYYANFLAVLLVLRSVGQTVGDIFLFSEETQVVLDFPVLLLCALMLSRLGHILTQLTPDTATEGTLLEGSSFRLRLARLIGRVAIVLAIAGPIMSAIGYDAVGQAMVYPAVKTLAVLALVLVLQRFVNDLYELITGRSAQAADSLAPVLAGLVLLLLALPALALIWGARVADLTELWARFREGFTFGDTRISPMDFLTFILVFAIGYAFTRLLQGGLRSSILPKTKIDPGGQNAIVSGLGYLGVVLAALIAITAAGLDLSSLAIVAGALSVGIGFGLQNIVSNFVSGIILLIERPISEGDWIEVNGNHGIVKDISVRSTRIETFDRTDLIVPNTDFVAGTVTNYTRGNVIGRVVVNVGVAYGSDTRKVESILRRIVQQHEMVLLNPEPMITFEGFGASSLDFVIRAIIRDVGHKLDVISDFHHEIARRFAEEGIEIPFAQRDVWLRNPEALVGNREDATDKPADGKPAPGASSEQSATTEQMPAGRAGDDGDGHGHGDGDGGGR
ncbi:MAG: DUF3772 domain-containing protein [Rhodobacteraceae bacterium]|jgi:potassium efflux system protein|uniref:Small-conductance mechanosensitive channel n=1 Tax=Salipiger profundus TaxID=1229727 RepID=A0A1U7DA60_9RHOB|nr:MULTISPECIES: DUF3772 domain-containing protein [Salipiger]APX25067.1 small-conductance mechanosensitive channel [Salipiger profundus]MAB07574.1 DUF3772 domain-containing protein [Paracoccaceae bacterium]GGA15152.1 mechanosensitive ion channel protein MscS [Salipiger profundus]SFD11572.1 Small-conductance mechanosensitive channel [Salipiger profundus]